MTRYINQIEYKYCDISKAMKKLCKQNKQPR